MRKPGLPKLTKQNMEDAPEEQWVESIKGTVNVAVQEIEKTRSENHGIKLLDSADVELVEIEVQVPDPWIQMTPLTGGWTDAGGGNWYHKMPDGLVEIMMDVTSGAGVAFTMPVGYRPARTLKLVGWEAAIASAVDVDLNDLGEISQSLDAEWRLHTTYMAKDTTPIALSCWPKLVKTKFKKVSAVVVANVADAETTKTLPAGCVYHPVWEMSTMNGTSQVKLLNIAGLPYNRKSRVSLLIFGG